MGWPPRAPLNTTASAPSAWLAAPAAASTTQQPLPPHTTLAATLTLKPGSAMRKVMVRRYVLSGLEGGTHSSACARGRGRSGVCNQDAQDGTQQSGAGRSIQRSWVRNLSAARQDVAACACPPFASSCAVPVLAVLTLRKKWLTSNSSSTPQMNRHCGKVRGRGEVRGRTGHCFHYKSSLYRRAARFPPIECVQSQGCWPDCRRKQQPRGAATPQPAAPYPPAGIAWGWRRPATQSCPRSRA